MTLEVRDAGVELRHDPARVVVELFAPGESTPGGSSRTLQVLDRVLAIPTEEIGPAAERILTDFGERHVDLRDTLVANAMKVHPGVADLDADLGVVLGASFSAEHSIEGAALCNPSAVPHPDQSGLAPGALRVAVSMRSIGEGHVSTISFGTAVIAADRTWTFGERALPLVRAVVSEGEWEADHFRRALEHHGQLTEIARVVLQGVGDRFKSSDIEAVILRLPNEFLTHFDSRAKVEAVRLIGRSAYDAAFPAGSDLSQRVLLPAADEERHGVEDARFVRFVGDQGEVEYRASYTAYDGRSIASRLLLTDDFETFTVHRMTGDPARTKGMAFFPRRINGWLYALTRSDGESNLLARSRDGLDWGDEVLVQSPRMLWEVVQTGNCGVPIETDRGWLVLTHGVGPMRRYGLGAILLDLDDPSRVVAQLESSLLQPRGAEQNGYVPNVVYSCGGLVHDGILWIPHGVGDDHIRVVSVVLDDLLDAMAPTG
ncbi:MAG: glycosylase [Pseudolysinimonas sp.]|uniref:glycoside hydrolase family 130 protein n=1 Tax=Pseudolysinimonas sp. TaxID=2680009 RepID=UPI0032641ED8